MSNLSRLNFTGFYDMHHAPLYCGDKIRYRSESNSKDVIQRLGKEAIIYQNDEGNYYYMYTDLKEEEGRKFSIKVNSTFYPSVLHRFLEYMEKVYE